jgi:uncharacterized SAM-binding protein YcdF (DUF218 family)
MRRLVRRTLLLLVAIVIVAGSWFVYYGGRYLQHEDPLAKADAIFVPGGTRVERMLEGYDLYRGGYAPLIVLSPGRPEPAESLLRSRGITLPSDVELQRDVLLQLGVPPAGIFATPGYLDNTAQEAAWLTDLAHAHGWHRVIVVTSKLHTRRSGVAFRRALSPAGVEVVMRATRYDVADPARWWRTRADFRFGISEWQKLIAYRLGLGG